MNRDLVALYSDYLLSSFGATTAAGLSDLLEGALIFDDTIQEKPYTDENELISWHFDHSKNRTVKGINPGSSPVPVLSLSKGQALRRMLSVCQQGQVAYRYVLADSWFSAKENLRFIRQTLGKHFGIALKSNRTVALSYEAKRCAAT